MSQVATSAVLGMLAATVFYQARPKLTKSDSAGAFGTQDKMLELSRLALRALGPLLSWHAQRLRPVSEYMEGTFAAWRLEPRAERVSELSGPRRRWSFSFF